MYQYVSTGVLVFESVATTYRRRSLWHAADESAVFGPPTLVWAVFANVP
jgi:hypothetical protein